ncbi:MAG TPA: aromatic aminobenezylarsenical efflux permease ArsG family transporter [Candidatus Omnitrophota bacterium]|nr:aromatic aminobenezylarsenical efflux permease ArsG family transporter [Candidatus Omnitrophota bacterium]HRZ14764.1 aromatic aminobenezylarsenical efflux permease ArsG family transporter [Candidatus Omnitrophota bacterium]
MTDIVIGLGSALWLGIMTSISPCPLATNVAAISFLAKKVIHPRSVLLSGIAYTAGRMVSYAALGVILINSILSIPQVAQFLQKYMPQALGPLLIVTGLVLLEIIKLNLPGVFLSRQHRSRLVEAGVPGAFLLGVIFALAFCPLSAALFFGSLIPLAIHYKSGIIFPSIYGVGTGLPVLVFAIAIALGVTSLSRWFNKITRIEYYARKITGVTFIIVGLYYAGVYILKLF